MKNDNKGYNPPCENPTMLYKLGGEYTHYEPKIGYIKHDQIIVDASEVQEYLEQGWGLNVTEMYLDSKKPKEIISTELEQANKKNKKNELTSDNNL